MLATAVVFAWCPHTLVFWVLSVQPSYCPPLNLFPVPWSCCMWRDPRRGWHTLAQVVRMPLNVAFFSLSFMVLMVLMLRPRKPRVLLALLHTSVVWTSHLGSEVILTPRYFACVSVLRVWPWSWWRYCDLGEPYDVGWCSLQCIFEGGKTASSRAVPNLTGCRGLDVGPVGHVGHWHLCGRSCRLQKVCR